MPILTNAVTWALVAWFASTASAQVDGAVKVSHEMPVVKQRLNDHDRRIDRLEALDDKIGKLSEQMAGVMVELKRR